MMINEELLLLMMMMMMMRETINERISNFFTIVCSRKELSLLLSQICETNSIIQRHSRDRFR